MSKVGLGSYGGLGGLSSDFSTFSTGWINKQTTWSRDRKKGFKKHLTNVFSAATAVVQQNVMVRNEEWDDFGADVVPKDLALKAELVEVQREVLERIEQLVPLRTQAAETVTAAAAIPQSVFSTVAKLELNDPAVVAEVDVATTTERAALMQRMSVALSSLGQLGDRSQAMFHSSKTLARASTDQATISASAAVERSERAARPAAAAPDTMCVKTSWCMQASAHIGLCTAVNVAPLASGVESLLDDAGAAAISAPTTTTGVAEDNAATAVPTLQPMAVETVPALPPAVPEDAPRPSEAVPESANDARDAGPFGNVCDPFASQAKVAHTPRQDNPLAANAPVARDAGRDVPSGIHHSRRHSPVRSPAVVAASPAAHPPKSSTKRRAAPIDEDDVPSAFQAGGMARTPLQTGTHRGRPAKRAAIAPTTTLLASPYPDVPEKSPIVPALNSTFTLEDGPQSTRRSSTRLSAAEPNGKARPLSSSTPARTPTRPASRSAKKSMRTPITQTPRTDTVRSQSKLRNSVGRV
eukprot:m.185000 g.185000  ORF g.185000 m.185000 type:complete len:525 (+) comp24712_c0_seq1:15-1589(+)